jgi:hypothetical protein
VGWGVLVSDIYEPWKPAVGQRVRIRVSPECQADHTWMDGVSGVVAEVEWSADLGPDPICNDPAADGYRGHWYMVDLDTPIDHPAEHRPIVADLFAAVEMEAV